MQSASVRLSPEATLRRAGAQENQQAEVKVERNALLGREGKGSTVARGAASREGRHTKQSSLVSCIVWRTASTKRTVEPVTSSRCICSAWFAVGSG